MADIKRFDPITEYIRQGDYVGAMEETSNGDYVLHSDHVAAIKAAVAETARRCAELCDTLAKQANDPDSVSKNRNSAAWQAAYHMCDASVLEVRSAIKAEFPEAFK